MSKEFYIVHNLNPDRFYFCVRKNSFRLKIETKAWTHSKSNRHYDLLESLMSILNFQSQSRSHVRTMSERPQCENNRWLILLSSLVFRAVSQTSSLMQLQCCTEHGQPSNLLFIEYPQFHRFTSLKNLLQTCCSARAQVLSITMLCPNLVLREKPD